MPPNSHFRVAASEVRRGMDDLRKHISEMRSQFDGARINADKNIENLKTGIRQDQANILRAQNSDDLGQSFKDEQIRDMVQKKHTADEVRHGTDRQLQDIKSHIDACQNALNGLESLARDLERRASTGGF